jgi:SAM-dependent methyltransferase
LTRWANGDDRPRGAEYDERWSRMEAAGQSIHGEADLICAYAPESVLDAGCGTGRVAIELARRGIDVVGVDLDEAMLDMARRKAPELTWMQGDLATVLVAGPDGSARRFSIVALPGNVMIFLAPGTEGAVVANMSRHLEPGGRLIAGFQIGGGHLDLSAFDSHAAAAGLELESRWSTWDREPCGDDDYAVSVQRRSL